MAKMKDRALGEVIRRFEKEIRSLKEEISKKEETVNSLQKLVTELKKYESYAEYKDRYYKLSDEYEKQKERLVKLHNLYNETETKCKNLGEEVKGWKNWFNQNKESFDLLFSVAPPKGTKERPEGSMALRKRKKIKFRKKKI